MSRTIAEAETEDKVLKELQDETPRDLGTTELTLSTQATIALLSIARSLLDLSGNGIIVYDGDEK